MATSFYNLSEDLQLQIKSLPGPIVIFGAGGFIGANMLKSLLLYRDDIFGVSQNIETNWRFNALAIPKSTRLSCDITDLKQLQKLIYHHKPQTIFNFAAYGAYSKQKDYRRIYDTNVTATITMLEMLKNEGFKAYVHAGSSSEYGLNSAAPSEDDALLPNSHYAVSKISTSYAIHYYGKIERLPVVNMRIYAAYGPWEEPDRLMPVLLAHARQRAYPMLVDPDISRDFIYTQDVLQGFILAAAKMGEKMYGNSFNVGTGKKTTIKDLTMLIKDIADIPHEPKFGSMPNRSWDVKDWYADISKIENDLGFSPKTSLEQGLKLTLQWQQSVNYDTADWNFAKVQ